MEKRVYAYNSAGDYLGYVRLGTDDLGFTVGEVYNTNADKLGAIRLEPLTYGPEESRVFEPDGKQVGFVRLERYENEKTGGRLFWQTNSGDEPDRMAHILFDPAGDGQAEVKKTAEWGQKLGSLKPENVDPDELVLVGGGSVLLLIL